MSIHRRTFLQFTVSSGLLLPCLSALATTSSGNRPASSFDNLILGGGKYQDMDTQKVHYVFSTLDLASKKSRQIPMDFLPHGIHAHPITSTRLAVFEKKGPGACEFDLEKQQIIRAISTDKRRYFYGHGAYSTDGKLLYCTESYLHNGDGIIAIRDSDSMKYLGEFPSYGKEPHECKLIDHGKVMVITNGGGTLGNDAPTVTYVDTRSHKLLKRETLTNSHLNTGHMAIGKDGSLVVVSAPRAGMTQDDLGGVSIQPSGQNLASIAQPQSIVNRMHGEALSVIIHEPSGMAAVTHPRGNMVTLWSIRQRKMLKAIDLPSPRGITLSKDDSRFLISYGQQGKIVPLSIKDLTLLNDEQIPGTFMTGSHIYNWSKTLIEILAPGPLF